MKYSPVMKKVDLTAQADRLREDALALVEEEEWDFQSRVMDVVRQAKRERVQIILLSGPTSSGKTTASRILSDGLSQDGSRSGRISLDDFYKNRDQAPLWEDGSKNFESIEGLDLEAFGSCLDTLFTTGRAQVPIFDFTTGTRSPLTQELTFDDDTCLIFEGLHAINPRLTPLLGKYRTMRIYISLHSDYVDHQGNLLLDGRSVRLLRRPDPPSDPADHATRPLASLLIPPTTVQDPMTPTAPWPMSTSTPPTATSPSFTPRRGPGCCGL